MAKKKYDPDDPATWSDEHMNKYIIDKAAEIGKNLPWETIVMSSIFIYAMWKAYGQPILPTTGDIMLGISYGICIPKALQGGETANIAALSALGILGLGLITPPDFLDKAKDFFDQDVDLGWSNITDIKDMFEQWWNEIPSLDPPTDLNPQ